MDRKVLKAELVRDEGLKLVSYRDTVGLWTIGVGHLLGTQRRMTEITNAEAMALLEADINVAEEVVNRLIPVYTYWDGDTGQGGYRPYNQVRSRALVNMAFNLGNRLAGFKKFLAAVNSNDWATAGVEMMDSQWAKQVGARAVRLRKMIETEAV
jgi:lysozyme